MVAAAALGDVVEQDRNVQHAARGNLLDDCGRDRVVVFELAALDRRKQTDRPDRMLIDRIMVIHVELHLRDDAAEVGNEATEHSGLVHPAKHDLGLMEKVRTSRNKAFARGSARTALLIRPESRLAARMAVG